MPKVITATEAKNRLGSYLRAVANGNEDIIIEVHGRPQAVLVPYDAYRSIMEERDRKRRHETVDRLIALADRVRARNSDWSEEQANAIAQEIRDAAIESVIARNGLSAAAGDAGEPNAAERRRSALAELERLNGEWMASGCGLDDEAAEAFGIAEGRAINRAVADRLRSAIGREAAGDGVAWHCAGGARPPFRKKDRNDGDV